MSADSLSQEYVRQVFRYDDGKMFWLPRPLSTFATVRHGKMWNTRFANKEAGCRVAMDGGDRWLINVGGRPRRRNILVWAYHNNWPHDIVDHINRDQLDDHIDNLRIATKSQNAANAKRPITNACGLKGASWSKVAGKWTAYIKINNKNHHLGYFATAEEAHEAYCMAAKEHFGEFAHAG